MFLTLGTLRTLVREALDRYPTKRAHLEQGRITPDTRFYHASPKRFRHGDILTGGHRGGEGTMHSNVCMTTSPDPHITIRSRIPDWEKSRVPDERDYDDEFRPGLLRKQANTDWYVYEVEPMHVVRYVEGNGEYQTRAARVIRNLGKASALLKKRHPDGGVAVALAPARDRDRRAKYAARTQRRAERRKDDVDE
jgi:hypothetical protein